jgi:hypothetical protein
MGDGLGKSARGTDMREVLINHVNVVDKRAAQTSELRTQPNTTPFKLQEIHHNA